MNDDAELLRRYVTGRADEAFAELVRRHLALVYSVALRQVGGDAHLAQDVAQTVFTALARKAGELSRRAVLGGWLYRCTQFTACDAVRAERRRRAREQEATAMHENSTAPAAEADWEKLRPVLDQVIGELPEKDRDAVWLRYFDEQSFAAIGDRLQLTENAARMRVERALDKLHARLASRGVTSTTAALALALPGQLGAAAPAGLAATLTQSALTGMSGAAATATSGWALFQIMSSTKSIVALAAAVSVAALGSAVYEKRQAKTAQTRLAAAQHAGVALQERIDELERRLADQIKQVASMQAQASASASALADRARSTAGTSANPTEEPITQESVRKRHARARELENQGQLEAALAEYLWCYDVGMPRFASYTAVRNTVPLEIAKLGERFPPALEALRERRAAAEHRLLASTGEIDALLPWRSLNAALQEENRSLDLHDRLPADDPRRAALGRLLFEQFTETQRYPEAAAATPYSQMSAQFEALIGRRPTAATPALAEQAAKRQRAFVIRNAAKHIEVLVGVGDLEHAADLALRVLAHDSSPETRGLLETHVARAGRPGLLAGLKTD